MSIKSDSISRNRKLFSVWELKKYEIKSIRFPLFTIALIGCELNVPDEPSIIGTYRAVAEGVFSKAVIERVLSG